MSLNREEPLIAASRLMVQNYTALSPHVLVAQIATLTDTVADLQQRLDADDDRYAEVIADKMRLQQRLDAVQRLVKQWEIHLDSIGAIDDFFDVLYPLGSASPEPQDDLWIACCDHCGCEGDQRIGHDDTCSKGCNDTSDSPVPTGGG